MPTDTSSPATPVQSAAPPRIETRLAKDAPPVLVPSLRIRWPDLVTVCALCVELGFVTGMLCRW